MADEHPLFLNQRDFTVTYTDGSGTPIVYSFRIAPEGMEMLTKRQRPDVRAVASDGQTVSIRKSATVSQHPRVVFKRLRIHNHDLGSTAITGTLGSLIALVRGTGPSAWTNTDSARSPDHTTGTLLVVKASVGTCDGEQVSYTKARLLTEDIVEEVGPEGIFIQSLTFECIDEPTITVNS